MDWTKCLPTRSHLGIRGRALSLSGGGRKGDYWGAAKRSDCPMAGTPQTCAGCKTIHFRAAQPVNRQPLRNTRTSVFLCAGKEWYKRLKKKKKNSWRACSTIIFFHLDMNKSVRLWLDSQRKICGQVCGVSICKRYGVTNTKFFEPSSIILIKNQQCSLLSHTA